MFDYFREAYIRKQNGHTLECWRDRKRLLVGWIDRTVGERFEAGLVAHVKPQFTDWDEIASNPGRVQHVTHDVLREYISCRRAAWSDIGLTWEQAREIIRTSESRALFFGSGIELDGRPQE